MEEKKDPLEQPPQALVDGQRTITLPSGKTVIIEKWGWRKLWDLARHTGDPDKIPLIARESVRSQDRESVDSMTMDDVLAIAAAAVDMNLTEKSGPNLLALAKAWGRLRPGPAPAEGTP